MASESQTTRRPHLIPPHSFHSTHPSLHPVPLWKTFLTLGGSLVVPNEGSTARDHLARDRNWQQWIRLSTTLAVVAAALILRFRFVDEEDAPHIPRIAKRVEEPLGMVFFALSLITCTVGFYEWWAAQTAMANNMGFVETGVASRLTIMVVALVTTATCVLLFVSNRVAL